MRIARRGAFANSVKFEIVTTLPTGALRRSKMPDQVEIDTRVSTKSECEDGEHDPHFEPIITLPLVKVSTNEEDEIEMCKIRARLYRFDKVDHEWKERGTGEIKLLSHRENNTVRVVMRRDKTLKLCANHFITGEMQLQPHIGSDRAFNWTAFGDYADETAKQEFLAVKFGNVDNANLWKSKFNEALEIVKSRNSFNNTTNSNLEESSSDESSSLSPNESTTENDSEQKSEIKFDKSPLKIDNAEVVLQLSDLKIDTNLEKE